MEKVILRLIGDLSTLLDCPNPWVERLADYEPLPTETIKTLDNELPNLLAYCKRVSVSPEVKVLMNLLAEVINKYGATSGVSPYRYSGYTVNAFADTIREIEETCIYSLDQDLANSCKPWLYWLYQYFPPQASEGVDELPTVELQELPTELNTEPARKYFARAVEAGLISEQFEWLATKAQLGYFCSKVYEQPRPITILEGFFNVKNLAASITQASYEPKRADVKKWRAVLDKTIFFD